VDFKWGVKVNKKLLLFGVIAVLLVSCVSAEFLYKNSNVKVLSEENTIGSIVRGFMVYKLHLKVEHCLDKQEKFILKDKKKVHPCLDKYFYFNSYFQVYNLTGGVLEDG